MPPGIAGEIFSTNLEDILVLMCMESNRLLWVGETLGLVPESATRYPPHPPVTWPGAFLSLKIRAMTYSIDGDFENPGVTITVNIGVKTHIRDWYRDWDGIIGCWDIEPACYHWLRDKGLSHDQCEEICWNAEHVGM